MRLQESQREETATINCSSLCEQIYSDSACSSMRMPGSPIARPFDCRLILGLLCVLTFFVHRNFPKSSSATKKDFYWNSRVKISETWRRWCNISNWFRKLKFQQDCEWVSSSSLHRTSHLPHRVCFVHAQRLISSWNSLILRCKMTLGC